MVETPMFYRFVFYRLPFWGKVAVLEIYRGCSYCIIAKNFIIVHYFDNQWSTSWEGSLKIKLLMEFRVRLIELPFLSLIVNFAAQTYHQVGV